MSHRVRGRVVVGVALATGAATAAAGAVSFVGLVVPHLLRPFYGYEPSRLILPSALGGAAAGRRRPTSLVRLHRAGRAAPARRRHRDAGRAVLPLADPASTERSVSASIVFENVGAAMARACALRDVSASLRARRGHRHRRTQRRGQDDVAARGARPSAARRADGARAGPRAGAIGRARRWRARIAYLPQGGDAHWPVLARDLVTLGRLPHRAAFAALSATTMRSTMRWRAAMRRSSPNAAWTNSPPASARACCSRGRWRPQAPILLADEPAAYLDPAHQLRLMDLLREEAARGTAVAVTLARPCRSPRATATRSSCCSEGRVARARRARPLARFRNRRLARRVRRRPCALTRGWRAGCPAQARSDRRTEESMHGKTTTTTDDDITTSASCAICRSSWSSCSAS